ncbi:metallophosphoesterase family protein [Clostridium folliculivorans]|uniref:Calcineurin-like phosphoesterase domain-containing protein n=1 Tax=Clostridium folliculivorans TaxID=2886038 RepID=A0A9W5Y212_9CLOT|nr:metallophosphoesterase [Clostridium folliculivorans]GKU25072.1 hypothetical protein CFOLD11_18980 [Clostridium folliculivorans]GKU31170.1 hypothetical protein CFB3_32770 [Clostridium folliculivorans]
MNYIDNQSINNCTKKDQGIILHLSDLHFTPEINVENEVYLLVSDLKKVYFDNPENTLRLDDIDYVVISGDFIRRGGSKTSFDKAYTFIKLLSERLSLPFQKFVIVPGNHDLSWDITMASYHLTQGLPGPNDQVVTNVRSDIFYLKRDDEEWYKKFTFYSQYLFERLYGIPFPTNPKKQLKVILGDFFDHKKIAFFMINTSAEIDQFHRDTTYFDTEGLISASKEIQGKDFIKIVVGHHPVCPTNGYGTDIQFSNAMQNEDFKFYMHGHVHRTISLEYMNPQNINPNMLMIGAGALSAQADALWPGVPERYNVIRIANTDKHGKLLVSVNTRQREYIDTFWQPAYIYYETFGKKLTNIWSNII